MLGGWRLALIAAGENPAEVARESRAVSSARKTKWTSAAILELIKARIAAGDAANVQALKDAGLGSVLRSAKRLFGSYERAIAAAGFEYRTIRCGADWVSAPAESVLAGIRALSAEGRALNISTAQHYNSGLVTAAINLYGSWDAALCAAGFEPEKIRLDVDTEAYKGRIFQNLCYDVFSILRPNWREDYRLNTDAGLLLPDAYDQKTGEWIDFKIAAWGMSVQKSVRKYLLHAPRLRIISLAGTRKSTERLIFESVFRYEAEATTPALRALFSRLHMLAAYTVPTTSFDAWATRWTRKEVLGLISALPKGEQHSRYAQTHHSGAYKSAFRLFGGWYPALEAAGLNVESVRRRRPAYTKTELDEFIKNRIGRGEPLSVKAVTSTPSGNGIFQTATRFYGSWEKALVSQGLHYEGVKEKPGHEVFTREVLEQFIRSRHSAGLPLNATEVRDNFKGHYGAAFRIHGGWREAVEAMGIPYASVSQNKLIRRIGKQELDAYIAGRRNAGLPLNVRAVCQDNRPMHTAACRKHYGSWKAALEANGISYASVSLRPRLKS